MAPIYPSDSAALYNFQALLQFYFSYVIPEPRFSNINIHPYPYTLSELQSNRVIFR